MLVVDDDPAARDLLKRFLNKEGFHVECAANGPEALAFVKHTRPTVITLDVMMPGMDGWAVLSRLKEDPTVANIPVIMLTIVDDKHFGHALGATEYLTKPVDREQLGAVRQLRCQSLWLRLRQIDSDFVHHCHDFRMNSRSRIRSC